MAYYDCFCENYYVECVATPQRFFNMVSRQNGRYFTKEVVYENREYFNGVKDTVEKRGKIVFPRAEDIANLCIGVADIWIEEDKGNYAIAKMQMMKYDAFSDDEVVDLVLDLLKNEDVNALTEMEIHHGSLKGDYVWFSTSKFVAKGADNRFYDTKDVVDALDRAKSVKKCTVGDFLAEHFGFDIEAMENTFHEFQFHHKYDSKINTNCSEIVNDAVDFGFLEQRRHSTGCDYFVLNKNALAEAVAYFSQEEIEAAVEEASICNDRANDHIRQQIKKGRLSVSMV